MIGARPSGAVETLATAMVPTIGFNHRRTAWRILRFVGAFYSDVERSMLEGGSSLRYRWGIVQLPPDVPAIQTLEILGVANAVLGRYSAPLVAQRAFRPLVRR